MIIHRRQGAWAAVATAAMLIALSAAVPGCRRVKAPKDHNAVSRPDQAVPKGKMRASLMRPRVRPKARPSSGRAKAPSQQKPKFKLVESDSWPPKQIPGCPKCGTKVPGRGVITAEGKLHGNTIRVYDDPQLRCGIGSQRQPGSAVANYKPLGGRLAYLGVEPAVLDLSCLITSNATQGTAMTPQDLDGELSVAIFDEPLAQIREDGSITDTTQPLSVFALVVDLRTEREMNGIFNWFGNSTGRYVHETVAALKAIGADQWAKCVKEMIRVSMAAGMTHEQIQADRQGRSTFSVVSWRLLHKRKWEKAERKIDKLDDTLDGAELDIRLLQYVTQHADELARVLEDANRVQGS